jgi:uncharacterized repeat protein (TIGR02543 family)
MMDDGTEAPLAVKNAAAGTAISPGDFPAPPSRTGYNFGGWYTEPNGGGTVFTASTTVSGSITVYAQWTEIVPGSYTVTFKLNDGTDNNHAVKTVTAPANTVTDFPADPARTDYNFTGWNTQQGGGGTFTSSTIVSGDITVYAQWTPIPPSSHTVTFKLNDGTDNNHAVKSVTPPANTVTDFPAVPTRTDYTFAAWNTQQNGGGNAFTASTIVSDDITVYAQWTPIPPSSHTVTFKLNDGTDNNHAVKTVTAPANTVPATDFPANPSRTDYNFAGWNTQQGGGGDVFDSSTIVSGDITVYAQWTATNTGTVITLNLDDGEGAFTQTSFTLSRGGGTGSQTVTITGGYTNPRWFVDGESAGTGSSVTILAGDYSLGAHSLTLLASKNGVSWSKELSFTVEAGTLRTVIFRANNGAGAIYAIRTTAAGSAISGFPGEPGRDGYDFVGWNTQAGGGGSAFDDTTTVSADVTVYAQWTGKTYTVTFMRNYDGSDATVLHTKTVTVPVTAIPSGEFPAAPSRSLYNFAGWNTQRDGSGAAFGQSSEVNGTITVYAAWVHEEFNITLDTDAGNGAFSQGTFTVYKSGGTGLRTISLSGTGYTNPRWFVDGEPAGTAGSINISATDYTAGGHSLTLLINKGGVSWSKELSFTVDAGTLRTVIFRANDGGGAIYAVRTTAAGSVTTGFPGDPGRDGYNFTGWNTQPGGGGTAFNAATVVNADAAVYAQWAGKTYTVTFMRNYDGSDAAILHSKTVTVPAKLIPGGDFPANPARSGYNFTGWNTQADGSGATFGQTTEVPGDLTVYAGWAPEQFSITLNPDAGAGAFSQTAFSIAKTGGGSQTVSLAGSGYTNPRWFVDSESAGTGASVTIAAADYTLGGHSLTLLITKNGVSWSKEITFTVTN